MSDLIRFSSRAVAAAIKSLDDYDPLFAVHAAQVLGRIGGEQGRAALTRAGKSETRVTVKAAIAQALKTK